MSQKQVPPLTGTRNETIRYYYSLSGQLNLSIFNLDSHTLYLKIINQTLEIQARKVKIYCAPENCRTIEAFQGYNSFQKKKLKIKVKIFLRYACDIKSWLGHFFKTSGFKMHSKF